MRPQLTHSKRPSSRTSTIVVLCGAAICITYISVIIWMFSSKPVTSEEDEMFASGVRTGRLIEWTPPEALEAKLRVTTFTKDVILSYFRLRVIVLLDLAPFLSCAGTSSLEAARRCTVRDGVSFSVRTHVPVLATLMDANYEDRLMPVDVDIITYVSGVPDGASDTAASEGFLPHNLFQSISSQFPWQCGRMNLQYRSGSQAPFSTRAATLHLESWLPTSQWELAMFVEPHAALSPLWFQWWQRAFRANVLPSRTGTEPFKMAMAPSVAATPKPRFSFQTKTTPTVSVTAEAPFGVPQHPFDAHPLGYLILPRANDTNRAEEWRGAGRSTVLLAVAQDIHGVVWSASAWWRITAMSRQYGIALTDTQSLMAMLKEAPFQSPHPLFAVQGVFADQRVLYRPVADVSRGALLLGQQEPDSAMTKEQFEADWCVFPEV